MKNYNNNKFIKYKKFFIKYKKFLYYIYLKNNKNKTQRIGEKRQKTNSHKK
jgi:hypothetical protein